VILAALVLSELMLQASGLPEGCVAIEGEHAISPQAAALYGGAGFGPSAGGPHGAGFVARPVARQAQSMRCGKDQGTVHYYQFATEADAAHGVGFIAGEVWGGDHPTPTHPELIDRWGDIVAVISFPHPEPIEKALMARNPGGTSAAAPDAGPPPGVRDDFEKGMAAYKSQDYAKAEASFRSVVAAMPDSAMAHLYLGHSIFYQDRFRDSIPEYEKAMDLGIKSAHLELLNQRILNDQLGMAYGLSGRTQDARRHFEKAIAKDPDYPFYYYNLACAEAELGDLDGALANLRKASERKAHFLPGESLPNPREDDSFKKYIGDPKFEATVKEIGF
jgi:hypothetical protein